MFRLQPSWLEVLVESVFLAAVMFILLFGTSQASLR